LNPASASPNETILTIGFVGLGIYFSILLVRGLAGYLRFRRVRPTALLTWPGPRPHQFALLVGLGIVSTAVAVVNTYMGRPLHHVFGLAVMSLYFVFMVPLSARIHLGFYRDGVWSNTGFLPYGKIARMMFVESPEIVLVLVPRGRSRSFLLPVPREEYGAARKVLEEKSRSREMVCEGGILGL